MFGFFLPEEMNASVQSHWGESRLDAMACNSQEVRLDDLITPPVIKLHETVQKQHKMDLAV